MPLHPCSDERPPTSNRPLRGHKKHLAWTHKYAAGLGVLLLGSLAGCSQSTDTQNASSTAAPGLVEAIEDTLNAKTALTTSENADKSTSQPKKPTKPLPPPKKEPWMDTLLDLSGVPAPNSAVLLEEDPLPLNLSSVEILIANRYAPKKPVSLSLRVYVTEAGTVRRVQVLRRSDPKLSEEYFLPALLELRFSPALYNRKPTAAWTTIHLQIKP